MAELKTLADKIGALFTTRSKRFSLGAIVVKVFVIAGSAIAVIAQFASAPESGVTGWQIAGIASAILVGLGGLFLLSIDRDAADELEAARQGLEAAREAQSEIEEVVYDLDRYEAKQIQAVELYAALRSMRDVIERAVTTPNTSETTIIDTLVTAAKRSILIALGFKQEDRWTVGVYKAEDNGASNALHWPLPVH